MHVAIMKFDQKKDEIPPKGRRPLQEIPTKNTKKYEPRKGSPARPSARARSPAGAARWEEQKRAYEHRA